MKFPLGAASLLLAAAIARADVVIVQQVDGMAQSGQETIMVNAAKVRADVSPQVSTITDVATGNVTTLMHAQKCYIVFTPADSAAMLAGAAGSALPALSSTAAPLTVSSSALLPGIHPPTLTETGKTEKINGYNATEYTFTNGNIKATYWICSDYPNAKVVMDALAKFEKGSLAVIAKGLAPDLSTIHGVPVKTEIELNGQKITTQLLSVAEQPVDPSEYQVPPDYTQMKMPAHDGPIQGPGVDF